MISIKSIHFSLLLTGLMKHLLPPSLVRIKSLLIVSVIAVIPLFAGSALAKSTLWGIYGRHNLHDCPVNSKERAKEVIALSESNIKPLMKKYGVIEFTDQYHSGLEHTFLWAVKTEQPHDLEEFSIELGLASWNELRFVPLRTFSEGVVPAVRKLHGLEDFKPAKKTFSSESVMKTNAKPTLWGIYGKHNLHDCPVNSKERAKEVIALSMTDLKPLMNKYGVTSVVDQYHSGLEHTFLWAVETKSPHSLEEFSIEMGIAGWNELRFVPLRTFKEGVVDAVRVLHGLENWKPKGKQ